MLKVGDTVRFSNAYLKSIGRINNYSRRSRFSKRGRQELHKIVAIHRGEYNWRIQKHTGDLVRLDNGKIINSHWMKFVRRSP